MSAPKNPRQGPLLCPSLYSTSRPPQIAPSSSPPAFDTTEAIPHHTTAAMAALGDDLLATVNKLQDLVFNTIGNDSLDLPQIVSPAPLAPRLSCCLAMPTY